MNALVETGTDSIRSAMKSSLYPGASDASVDMVLAYCQAAHLDPMTKPVHIVPVWDSKIGGMRDVVMPGIGMYRTVAARTGCAGITEPEFGPDIEDTIGGAGIIYPQWCRVTVRRRLVSGEIVDFTARELWLENYAVKGGKERSIAPNAMWSKRPYGQLAKCAEAQALRKAFPEVGAQPTAEEMEGKSIYAEEHEQRSIAAPVPAELPPYSDKDFMANLPKWLESIEAKGTTPEARAEAAQNLINRMSTKYTLTEGQKEAINPPGIEDGEFTSTEGEQS